MVPVEQSAIHEISLKQTLKEVTNRIVSTVPDASDKHNLTPM